MPRKNKRKVTIIKPIKYRGYRGYSYVNSDSICTKPEEVNMGKRGMKGCIDQAVLRDEILNQFQWTEKPKGYNREMPKDVRISFTPMDKKKYNYDRIAFYFKLKAAKDITETDYIQFCINKNRIYFREADSDLGYKLTKTSSKTDPKMFVRIHALSSGDKEFEGSYDLRYDEFLELFYIEKVKEE